MQKPKVYFLIKDRFESYLAFLNEHPQHLDSKEGVEFFVQKISLQIGGRFGDLVASCMELMEYLEDKSKFFQGAYEFWAKSFFHDTVTLPKSWRNFLKAQGFKFTTTENKKKAVQKLEFALETAYNIFSRLILAKAIEGLGFH